MKKLLPNLIRKATATKMSEVYMLNHAINILESKREGNVLMDCLDNPLAKDLNKSLMCNAASLLNSNFKSLFLMLK